MSEQAGQLAEMLRGNPGSVCLVAPISEDDDITGILSSSSEGPNGIGISQRLNCMGLQLFR